MMHAVFARAAGAAVRKNAVSSIPAVAGVQREGFLPIGDKLLGINVGQQQRSFASERFIYGMKVTNDMEVSDPVRRVLSANNADT